MKRQFVPFQPSQGGDFQEQNPVSNGWPPSGAPDAQPQEASPYVPGPATPRKGLLNWKAPNDPGQYSQMPPQPVLEHYAVPSQPMQKPITGPIYQAGNTPPAGQQYFQGQVSPYQSGISSQADFYAPTQAGPFNRSTQVQMPPASQPQPPFNIGAGGPQPLPRVDVWQQGPMSYQGMPPAAMPPPAMVPPAMQQAMMQASMMPPPVGMRQQQQPPMMRPPVGMKSAPRKKKFPMWARVCLAVCLLLVVLSGTGFAYYQVNFANHIGNITGQKAAVIKIHGKTGDGDNANQAVVNVGNNIGTKRINILLLGSDNDQKFSSPLAQTDIVLTIDPTTKYVGMLSIPRDFWLNVPNFGAHKLDEAFSYGWSYVHDGPTPISNAAGLSIATIESVFGIPIDHYAWVGLDGFIKVIDTANGVDIDATHPMTDDIYPNDVQSKDAYGYKRLYIAPGPQHMNGIQALEYVRTRHSDLVGDFGRSARQQQILSQLKTKLANPSIVGALPQLTKDLDGYVKTDMDLPTIVNMVGFAKNIDPNKIDRLVLSPPYSSSFTAPNGEDAYKANCALIVPKVAAMFALGNNARCNTQVNVQNGSTPTLASTSTSSVAATFPASNSTQTFGQMAQVSGMSVGNGGNGSNDLLGVHSLLDLMFSVVFESFDAMRV